MRSDQTRRRRLGRGGAAQIDHHGSRSCERSYFLGAAYSRKSAGPDRDFLRLNRHAMAASN
jgi:hypothetical protein